MADEDTLVLVTGASGYVATHLIQQLQQLGYRVRGTVRSLNNEKKIAPIRRLCPEAKHAVELVVADLTKEDGWAEAIEGCTYVMHVASPLPEASPKHEDELIKPAVEGTLLILRACAKSTSVKRVMLTSSCAAITAFTGPSDHVLTDKDWTDTSKAIPYIKSKALAEKAAWDFLQQLPDGEKFELCTLNPCYIAGPILCGGSAASMVMVKRVLEHGMTLLPRFNFPTIDVRDVALAHVRAMTSPEAAGRRFILYNDGIWLRDVGAILDAEFKSQGYNPLQTEGPDFVMKFLAMFDSWLKDWVSMLGIEYKFDTSPMREVLGITPLPLRDTFIDMAYTMIENGSAKKTPQYKGRQASQ